MLRSRSASFKGYTIGILMICSGTGMFYDNLGLWFGFIYIPCLWYSYCSVFF